MAAKARIAGLNEGYARELYEAYRADPGSVPEDWRQFFAEGGGELVAPEAPAAPRPAAGGVDPRKAAAAVALALRIRQRGHLLARLDPLGTPPPGDPGLTIEYHGLSEDDLAALPAGLLDGPLARDARTAGDVIGRLRAVYCDRIGYDLAHVQDHDEREWWIEAVESGRYLAPLAAESRRELLRRLTVVEVFEQFLHRTFVGRTRFSIEGVDMLVPMLDTLLGLAAKAGIPTVALGMAHRGRLNVLAHVLGKPYEDILKELMGLDPGEPFAQTEGGNLGYTGDVTYHLGRAGQLAAYPIRAILANNPSHLEFVDPVVLGVARAIQDERAEAGPGRQDVDRCLPILIHGDASFPGEGIVAETMNLSRLVGYRVGGTVHLILNNQLGYTTTPREGRSTTYASDAAGGFEIPVLHVNADDPEACLVAVRMAFDYRRRFHKDVLVDLVGYRRWGHNEGDEPSFTQPVMYRVIAEHPTVRTIWARSLVAEGVVSEDEVEAMRRAAWEALQAVRERVQAEAGSEGGADGRPRAKAEDGRAARAEATASRAREAPATSVPLARLRRLNEEALALPAGFALHPKLERQLAHRLEVVRQGGALDWAHAELLAFASILADGTPIRLTGQDTLRGTFNQRHVAFFDYHTGQPVLPLQRMPSAKAAFMAYNSPLAEAA
ncbi:MAG: 2-oxoglutarate dehydrogenase E1 component, partial [Clostridia bacterium]|nr:2-oxoglutarate dehydrogenase E1 component [Clostridia bacterium]